MPSTSPTTPNIERVLLVGAVALITIGAFENLAVTTILPVIARDLDGFAIYALAAGLPLALQVVANAVGGLLIDAISFQRPLLFGVLTTAAGLLTAGFAPEMWVLALGRGVAGFGIGLITVSLYAAVGLVVPPERRPGFFAAFSAAWVVPSMVGPALAGILADAGW
ncbi:MAG TPA: MFS transporter, partial [Actinomycetales bacterium]|nr:MFS transporter [Actinomycetales bacterium]